MFARTLRGGSTRCNYVCLSCSIRRSANPVVSRVRQASNTASPTEAEDATRNRPNEASNAKDEKDQTESDSQGASKSSSDAGEPPEKSSKGKKKHDNSALLSALESVIKAQKKSLQDQDKAKRRSRRGGKAKAGENKTVRRKRKDGDQKPAPNETGDVPIRKQFARDPPGGVPGAISMSLKEGMNQKAPARKSPISGTTRPDIQTVEAENLEIKAIPIEQPPVPSLSYGLERVLFNPGVYHLQDPRSRVFNFDPYLQKIMPVAEFDFDALKEYITSSKDEALRRIATEQGKKYVGSTSSMTAALAHFHFLLSQWRSINTSMISQGFPDKLRSFTQLQRAPSAIFLRWKDGTYAVDADKAFDSANILSMLGKSMEKLLTLSKDEYERYRVSHPDGISQEEQEAPESFHYSTMGDFLMRSQLDAHDERLPGTGMFDLKTRAVITVRMDAKNYEHGRHYQIRTSHGEYESFEREYFDMIRSAFLKYSLQVRMGRMDGIFVAFHNTERIFGFQYISLPEMDNAIHGQATTVVGDQEFKLSVDMLNRVLERATKQYPEQSLRLHFETREAQTPFMYIFAEPVTEEQADEIQSSNQEAVREFERNVLGLKRSGEEAAADTTEEKSQAKAEWDDIQSKVEEEVSKDEVSSEDSIEEPPTSTGGSSMGPGDGPPTPGPDSTEPKVKSDQTTVTAADDAENDDEEDEEEEEDEEDVDEEEEDDDDDEEDEIEETDGKVIESGEIVADQDKLDAQRGDKDGDKDFLDQVTEEHQSAVPQEPDRRLLGMILTVRNKVNGQYVLRPEDLSPQDKWSVEYALAEIPTQSRAWSLYAACQNRRKLRLDNQEDDGVDIAKNYYLRRMRELSAKGKEWRALRDEEDQQKETFVLGQEAAAPVKGP
ncbi:MAG: hypothetical protein M1819_004300 [Sarea resinae]|nr:MAG: hypothetical protein M1819_004300 [Sarea resinae]